MPAPKKAAKRKSNPRKHEVIAALSNVELVKAGSSMNLAIVADGEKLGSIEIGRGSLFWKGKGKQTRKRIDWSRFAGMMNQLAYGSRS